MIDIIYFYLDNILIKKIYKNEKDNKIKYKGKGLIYLLFALNLVQLKIWFFKKKIINLKIISYIFPFLNLFKI